jgi:hypothetical protein
LFSFAFIIMSLTRSFVSSFIWPLILE